MAIRAGQILHVANGFVIDRIQTAGPGSLNIPEEKVHELGNYKSVGIVRDVPDLSFSLDCLNVDTEVEGLLCGSVDPTADADQTEYDLSLAKPINILSPWKSPYGAFTAVKGVAIPQLSLESASYRYGLRENAGEQFSLKGDSIFYVPGSPKTQRFTGDGTTVAFTLTGAPALGYDVSGVTTYALSVSVDGSRKFLGADYTETSSVVTFLVAPAVSAKIDVVFGVTAPTTLDQTVHQDLTVKPAAIRGKDIDVYFATSVAVGGGVTNRALTSNEVTLTTASAHGLGVGDTVVVLTSDTEVNGTFTTIAGTTGSTIVYALTHADITSGAVTGSSSKAVEVRWPDVQSCNIDWRVQLEDDMEFGNVYAVAREATDVPEVSGSIEIKPRSLDALFARLQQITGVAAAKIIGPNSSILGALRVELRNPESAGTSAVPAGTPLKTHYIPAARFTIPGYEGRVQQKLQTTLAFTSDDGVLKTYKGTKA
jgi:hypothetical protein